MPGHRGDLGDAKCTLDGMRERGARVPPPRASSVYLGGSDGLGVSRLQLLQGLVVDGAHAVVDKHAAQKHGQGKDPRVILRVTLGRTLGPDLSEFMHGNSFRH